MRANEKNNRVWTKGLRVLIGASALLAACTTDGDDTDMSAGTFAVTGFDLGSCVEDTWQTAATTTTSLVIEEQADAFVINACTQQGCARTTPSLYVWNNERWNGQDGGAYLTESGCLIVRVNATVYRAGDELTIEAERWNTDVPGGLCTYDAVKDLTALPCTGRTRLRAVQQ